MRDLSAILCCSVVCFALTPGTAPGQTIQECESTPVQLTVAVTSEIPEPIFTGQSVSLRITEPMAGRQVARLVILVNGDKALEVGSQQLKNLQRDRVVDFPIEVAVGGDDPYTLNLRPNARATVAVFAYDEGPSGPPNCGHNSFRLLTGKVGTFAVVVGFNYAQYPYSLRWAQKDAEEIVKHLIERRKVPRENIRLLTDDPQAGTKFPLPMKVTLAPRPVDLRNALSEVQNGADPSSTLFFYFSGHVLAQSVANQPTSEKYLVFGSSDIDDVDTMFARSELFQQLSGQNSKSISILDACYSGNVVAAYSAGPSAGYRGKAKLLGTVFRGTDTLPALNRAARIASSRANRMSWEFDELKHSVFTKYLLEAGADGQRDVTIMNAFDIAQDRTRNFRPTQPDVDYQQDPEADWNSDVSRELWSLRITGSQ